MELLLTNYVVSRGRQGAINGTKDSTECPLSGVKQTWAGALHMSAFDPKRTLACVTPDPDQCASLNRYNALS